MEPKKSEKKKFLDCTLQERKTIAAKQLQLYPDHVPIYMEANRSQEGKDSKPVSKRYNFHREQKVMEITHSVEALAKFAEQHSTIFFFTKHPKPSLLTPSTILGELYDRKKSDDGWLYMLYDSQKVFGTYK